MQIVIRAGVMFLFIWFITRSMGKKELSNLTVFEMILLIVTGDLIQQGVMQEDNSMTGAALAIATLALFVVGISYASFKWGKARPALEGVPVIIVRDGQPLEQVMKLERLSLDEVKEAARQDGITDLASVEIGVLEADGKFSFLQGDSSKG
jgi:uncharacterized membrane protein YcaP (DUF421 family)